MSDDIAVCRHCHQPIIKAEGLHIHLPKRLVYCANGVTMAAPLEEPDIVDAEVVDWPDVDARSPIYRQPDRPDEPDIIDAEIVEDDEPMTAVAVDVARNGSTTIAVAEQLPDGRMHVQAHAVIKPKGDECWWRLYRKSTSPIRDDQDHGILSARRGMTPQQVVLDIADVGRYELSVLDWRVSETQAISAPGRSDDDDSPLVDWLDLLVDFPPVLPPRPRQWQQLTQPGQLTHPGDDPSEWRHNWWDAAPAPRPINFERDELIPNRNRLPKVDRLPSAEGFADLGYIGEDGLE